MFVFLLQSFSSSHFYVDIAGIRARSEIRVHGVRRKGRTFVTILSVIYIRPRPPTIEHNSWPRGLHVSNYSPNAVD